MARKRRITTRDVAERAGVSPATVSVVMNNARSTVRVSPATREKIQKIAAEVGYSPNRAAQALRRQRSGVVCFVPMAVKAEKRPFDIPVQTLLGSYVSRAALSNEFHVIEVPAEIAASNAPDDLVGFVDNLHADGVIFHGAQTGAHIQSVLDLGIPVIQLMRPHHGADSSTVTVDPEPGFEAAIDHLTELGHRRIAFVGTASDHPNDVIRQQCFSRLAHARGLDAPPGYRQERGRYSIEDGYVSTSTLVGLPSPPSAIVAAGDVLALGALHALYDARLRVPDDMSLVSYDDAFADRLYPPLTTMAQPFQQVAERAVSLIADLIAHPATPVAPPVHEVFPSQLIVRSSTGPTRGEEVHHG